MKAHTSPVQLPPLVFAVPVDPCEDQFRCPTEIDRNSTIPLRNSLTFTTVVDNQSSVEIHILQGEREVAAGNRSLGKFELVGIPPSPRGGPQIDVTFVVANRRSMPAR